MDLPLIWFLAIAILWTGYFVLEGFDFGVGMLLPWVGRDETGRRVMINSIGPVWDGNEVWLITAVGAMFAAFPAWYAGTLSGFYVPLLFVLLALIGRGVAFEYRAKAETAAGRARWDAAIIAGSVVPAFVWGLVFANMVRGVDIGADWVVRSSLLSLLSPYALLGGVTMLTLFALHGALFLGLKTDGPVRARARVAARRIAVVTVPAVIGFGLWTIGISGPLWTWGVLLVGVLALLAAVALSGMGREGWAFAATAVTIAGLSVVLFGSLYPAALPSLISPDLDLTLAEAASAPYTLGVMTVVAVIFLPLVLAYQAWTYWVFRKRVTPAHVS